MAKCRDIGALIDMLNDIGMKYDLSDDGEKLEIEPSSEMGGKCCLVTFKFNSSGDLQEIYADE